MNFWKSKVQSFSIHLTCQINDSTKWLKRILGLGLKITQQLNFEIINNHSTNKTFKFLC